MAFMDEPMTRILSINFSTTFVCEVNKTNVISYHGLGQLVKHVKLLSKDGLLKAYQNLSILFCYVCSICKSHKLAFENKNISTNFSIEILYVDLWISLSCSS